MLLNLLIPVVLGSALRVEGVGTCPDPSEVSANVRKVVDLSDESAQKVHATLSRDGTWLVLHLSGGDNSSLGERRLPYEGDCAVLARAAAVVFAAWLSEEHAEFLVNLPPVNAGTPPVEAAAPSPPPPLPALEPPPPRVPTRAIEPKAPPAVSAVTRRRFSLSAALGGVSNGAQFAPGAWLGLSWDPSSTGFGARLGVGWTGTRSRDLQDTAHQYTWSRWPLLVGPYLRLMRGRASFDLEGGGALAWLRVGGQNFSSNSSYDDASYGAYAKLTFMPPAAPWHAFVSVAPVLWLRRASAQAKINGLETNAKIPSFEALFALGAQLPL